MRPGRAVIDYGEPQHCVSALWTEYGDKIRYLSRQDAGINGEGMSYTSLSIKGPFFFDYFVIIKTLLAIKK